MIGFDGGGERLAEVGLEATEGVVVVEGSKPID
jgi:hypothetical protein